MKALSLLSLIAISIPLISADVDFISEIFATIFNPLLDAITSCEEQSEEAINVQFVVVQDDYSETWINWNAINSQVEDLVDANVIHRSLPTLIMVHGWNSDFENSKIWCYPTINTIKGSLSVEANVIFVDWKLGAANNYLQSAANAKVVASLIVKFIQKLMSNGLDYSTIRLVGHSLGAQIVGLAGNQLVISGTPLFWITGLDPAFPLFVGPINVDGGALTKSSAQFVDYWHSFSSYTDGYSSPDPQGCLDVYLNGGTNQPGCDTSSFKVLEDVFASSDHSDCNHDAAPFVWSYTLPANSAYDCQLIAFECESYERYLGGCCVTNYAGVGLSYDVNWRSLTPPDISCDGDKKYFLKTSVSPYCRESLTDCGNMQIS